MKTGRTYLQFLGLATIAILLFGVFRPAHAGPQEKGSATSQKVTVEATSPKEILSGRRRGGARAGRGRADGSGVHDERLRANNLRTHGRYVAFIVDPEGQYTFCDRDRGVRRRSRLASVASDRETGQRPPHIFCRRAHTRFDPATSLARSRRGA